MREIKFRGWTGTTMIENLCVGGDFAIELILNGIPRRLEEYQSIMQYTGLHDKAGKEIYEGDIVLDTEVEKSTLKHIVSFGKIGYDGTWNGLTGFSFKEYQTSKEDFMELHYHDDPSFLEVVGNIYEGEKLIPKKDVRMLETNDHQAICRCGLTEW